MYNFPYIQIGTPSLKLTHVFKIHPVGGHRFHWWIPNILPSQILSRWEDLLLQSIYQWNKMGSTNVIVEIPLRVQPGMQYGKYGEGDLRNILGRINTILKIKKRWRILI